MQLIGRGFRAGSGSYRYSINGQEKEEEELNNNITSAEFWMYDSRLVRRWNVDPIVKPWESGYVCFFNNPILVTDVNGLDGDPPVKETSTKNNPKTLPEVVVTVTKRDYVPKDVNIHLVHMLFYQQKISDDRGMRNMPWFREWTDEQKDKAWVNTWYQVNRMFKDQWVEEQVGGWKWVPIVGNIKAGNAYKKVNEGSDANLHYMLAGVDVVLTVFDVKLIYDISKSVSKLAMNHALLTKAVRNTLEQLPNYTIKSYHIAGVGQKRKAKFLSEEVGIDAIGSALKNARNSFVQNSDNSFYIIEDVGHVIGTKGETAVKVIFSRDGKIISAYPVR